MIVQLFNKHHQFILRLYKSFLVFVICVIYIVTNTQKKVKEFCWITEWMAQLPELVGRSCKQSISLLLSKTPQWMPLKSEIFFFLCLKPVLQSSWSLCLDIKHAIAQLWQRHLHLGLSAVNLIFNVLSDSYLGSPASEGLVGSLAAVCESVHLFIFGVIAKSYRV